MKVERFIVEYANFQTRRINNNDLMNAGIKKELSRRIESAIDFRRRDLISADEAVKIIGGFTDKNEDFTEYIE